MGIFSNIFKNESIQKMAFGQLKQIFSDGTTRAIVLAVDSNGEIIVDLYGNPVTVNEINDKEGTLTQRTYGNGDVTEFTQSILPQAEAEKLQNDDPNATPDNPQ